MSFLKYKEWCRWVKNKYPELRIQRRRCSKKCYGWYKDNLIVVDKNADEDLAIWIVIHEVGHHLCKDKEKVEHDKAFGVGYYKAYQLYLDWANEREKE